MPSIEAEGAGVLSSAGRGAVGSYIGKMGAADGRIKSKYPQLKNALWVDGEIFRSAYPLAGHDRIRNRRIWSDSFVRSPRELDVSGINPRSIYFEAVNREFMRAIYPIGGAESYFFIMSGRPTNGGATGARGLIGQMGTDGNSIYSWITQTSIGSNFAFSLRHGGESEPDVRVNSADSGITPFSRTVLWGGYNADTGMGYIGRSASVLLASRAVTAPKKSARLMIGSLPYSSAPTQTYEGRMEFMIVCSGQSIWNATAGHEANTLRASLILDLQAIYNLAL